MFSSGFWQIQFSCASSKVDYRQKNTQAHGNATWLECETNRAHSVSVPFVRQNGGIKKVWYWSVGTKSCSISQFNSQRQCWNQGSSGKSSRLTRAVKTYDKYPRVCWCQSTVWQIGAASNSARHSTVIIFEPRTIKPSANNNYWPITRHVPADAWSRGSRQFPRPPGVVCEQFAGCTASSGGKAAWWMGLCYVHFYKPANETRMWDVQCW